MKIQDALQEVFQNLFLKYRLPFVQGALIWELSDSGFSIEHKASTQYFSILACV